MTARRRSRGCGRWRPDSHASGWWVATSMPGAPGRVFVYSGQGSQWAGMGRQLLADEPAFAKAVAELEPIFVAEVGFSLQQTLIDGDEVVGIDRIQPVLVGMQLALTELWRSYHVTPDAVIGHSMGEVSAAVVAGALTAEQGLRVIATRSRLMARLSGQGAMALLELDADAAEALIADYPQVTLAVYASPRQSVIAGPPEQVDAVISAVAAQNRLARRVEVDVASHHPDHRSDTARIAKRAGGFGSAAAEHPDDYHHSHRDGVPPVLDADYWAANLRNPVRFHQAVAHAISGAGGSNHAFIEISPHPVLTHAITDTLDGAGSHLVTSAMNRDQDQTLFFHTQLAAVGVTASDSNQRSPRGFPTHTVAPLSILGRGSIGDVGAGRYPPAPGRAHRDAVRRRPCLAGRCRNRRHAPGWPTTKCSANPSCRRRGLPRSLWRPASEALGVAADAVVINQFEVEQMLPLDSHTQLTTQLIRNGDSKIRVEIYSRSPNGDWLSARHGRG